MCGSHLHRPPSIQCILPPHVLRNLASRAKARLREAALRTMSVDSTFRAMRGAMRAPGMPAVRRVVGAAPGVKQRSIYTAGNVETLPGTLVRAEGQAAGDDVAVNEAYDGLGATHDFFWQVFERDSIDDDGMPLEATVHYGQEYDNAFWNGQRMVFGDGDGELFNRFTIALDVIGHELAHGVTEDEAGLVYMFQPGALNESMSDVFGSLVKQKLRGQTADQADWLIGEGLLATGVQGVALRSMRAPGTAYDDPILGKDPQPAHMSDYVNTYDDNGGVHINSGIPNHAFYLVATALGGYAWERAGRIWYEALRDRRLRRDTGFRRFARLTREVAERLYEVGSTEALAVKEGWAGVGIGA
jgi:Zn-dependent metalloprotease